MKVQVCGVEQAGEIAGLSERCFPDNAGQKWSVEGLSEFFGDGNHIAFGVFEAGLASVLLAKGVGDEVEILTLASVPELRRRGYARLLLAHFLEGQKGKCVFLELAENNRPALALYQSFGFEVFSKRSGYYGGGIAALCMRRNNPLE